MNTTPDCPKLPVQMAYNRLALKHKLWSQWSNISGIYPHWWSGSRSSGKQKVRILTLQPLLHSWHQTL